MEAKLETGAILARAGALLGLTLAAALPAFAALVAISVAFDYYPELGAALNFGVLAATMVAQYLVTRQAMGAAGLPLSDRKGVGTSFVGAAILIGIGSGLALLLLIVPGIYLYARWSLTMPVILGEGERMSDAMRTSDARTKGNIVPIAIALTIANLPWVASLVVLLAFYPAEGEVPLALSLLTGIGINISYLASWFSMVAAYEMLRPTHQLQEVFA